MIAARLLRLAFVALTLSGAFAVAVFAEDRPIESAAIDADLNDDFLAVQDFLAAQNSENAPIVASSPRANGFTGGASPCAQP